MTEHLPRVVMVSGTYPDMKCGVSLHTATVAGCLACRGRWNVHVLTSRDPRIRKDAALFQVHPAIDEWSVRRIPGILRWIRRLSPDILHIQYPTAAYSGRMNLTLPLLLTAGRKHLNTSRVVVTQHDLAIGHSIMQYKHSLLLRRSHAVTVSNDRDFQAIEKLSAQLTGKTHMAHLASLFDVPVLSDAEQRMKRLELGLPAEVPVLIYFGFIIPSRRIETLIRAAAVMKGGFPAFRLVLMGGAGSLSKDYVNRCRMEAERLGVSQNVLWTGYVEKRKVEDFLAVSDLFVSAIERGADLRNSTIIAAAAAGLPVLTTENPTYGIDRELRTLDFCRYFDAREPEDLAAKALAILEDPQARNKMKEAGRRFSSRCTWDEHVRILERAYRGDPPEPYDPLAAGTG